MLEIGCGGGRWEGGGGGGGVVLSAVPARLLTDCIAVWTVKGLPVSAPGVGGNGPWKTVNCSPHLEVAFRPCVSGYLNKIK